MRRQSPLLAHLATSGTAMLTTYRRSGKEVSTPVSIVVQGDRLYFATAADSGKTKRLLTNDQVVLAPCTPRGKVTGLAIVGRAREYRPANGPHRWRLLSPSRSMFWSWLGYRVRGKDMRLYEVTPAGWSEHMPGGDVMSPRRSRRLTPFARLDGDRNGFGDNVGPQTALAAACACRHASMPIRAAVVDAFRNGLGTLTAHSV